MFELGTTKLIFPNEGFNDNMKIDKTLEESSLLIKGISETENESKEQKHRFIDMLLGTSGASLLGNLWTGTKYIKRHN